MCGLPLTEGATYVLAGSVSQSSYDVNDLALGKYMYIIKVIQIERNKLWPTTAQTIYIEHLIKIFPGV
jgi:hypothetical protein